MFRKYKNWVFILAAEVIMTSNSTGYSKRDAKSAGICEYLLVCKSSGVTLARKVGGTKFPFLFPSLFHLPLVPPTPQEPTGLQSTQSTTTRDSKKFLGIENFISHGRESQAAGPHAIFTIV